MQELVYISLHSIDMIDRKECAGAGLYLTPFDRHDRIDRKECAVTGFYLTPFDRQDRQEGMCRSWFISHSIR